MPLYQIRNVPVEFPYEAYDLQVEYMQRVIQSLQEKKHALLESPTGTGKTLCLLCATLAWRQEQQKALEKRVTENERLPQGEESKWDERKLPPIIYSSRTHSQLSQAMKEIKKTTYKYPTRVRVSVLGSRQQQCCHPKLSRQQGTAKNQGCIQLIKSKLCQWHTAMETESATAVRSHAMKVMDIEDLNKLAKKGTGPCPYYLSRRMAEISDIVFVPYNYLVDKKARQSIVSLFSWTGSVVIFDEAHNIEQSCSEAASFDLPVTTLTTAALELEKALRLCAKRNAAGAKMEDGQNPKQKKSKQPSATKSWNALSEKASTMINMIRKLESNLSKMKIGREGNTFAGDHIFKLFSDACITDLNWKVLIDTLHDAAELLADDPHNSQDSTFVGTRLNGSFCAFFADALEKAFDTKESPSSGAPPYHKVYRVHLHDDRKSSGPSRIVLSYWCFSPGIAMKQFVSQLQIQNVILTSGTLSPMDSFASELHLAFPIRLENNHIVTKKQAFVTCVPVGPRGAALDSSYKFRDDPRYKTDLGQAVLQFLKIIPGGVLMFFPSYIVLQNCVDHWKSFKQGDASIWDRILQIKSIVVEPQNASLFSTKIREYQSEINKRDSNGCILLAVCRGKVSEGIDFSDNAGRAVILAGIPYAQLTDPKVKLKREFLNAQKSSLNGAKWYCQTAIRAVNQAMGRVIRHKDDYGAVLLCDRRFCESNIQSQLSKWLQQFFTRSSSFGTLLGSLNAFFKTNQTPLQQANELQTEQEQPPSGAWKREALIEEMQDVVVSPKRQRLKSPAAADAVRTDEPTADHRPEKDG